MKKLINTPEREVDEALAGMAAAHPDLLRVEEPNIIVRKDAPRPGKLGVISGSGSGHEPMHGGFVGLGMLDAACPGAVFTSPVPEQMLAATKAVNGGAGVLHIVKNYTGDIMNFEIAAEMAQAEGIEVASVVIADDVAVKDSLYTAGRRGVGGTVLAEKIVGAAAEAGADLKTVTALCQKVQDNVRSMGIALTSCTVPAAGKPTFDISDAEMEIGVGIHGEPGRRREALRPADDLLGEHGAADAAATRGVERVLHGDVVGDDDRGDLDPLRLRELGRDLKVHDVAGVVLHDVKDAGTTVDRFRGGEHLVRHGRGEDRARAGRIQHAEPDEAAVHRLVAGATAGDDAHLAGARRVLADDDVRFLDADQVGVRRGHTGERFVDLALRGVDELLHALLQWPVNDGCSGMRKRGIGAPAAGPKPPALDREDPSWDQVSSGGPSG